MDSITQKNIISADKINNLYKDLNYYDLYGGSVLTFIILIIILMLSFSYIYVMINIQPIKDNWAAERCNPKVIPFAGLINRPPGTTAFQYTQENYNFCIQDILTNVTGIAVEPLTIITNNITEMYNTLVNSINSMRTMFSNIRTSITHIAEEILGRILNIFIPIQNILVNVVDMFQKVNGIMTATLYTVMGMTMALKSVLGAIVEFIIVMLIATAAIIILLFINPFTIPVAAASLIVWLVFAVACALLITFMVQVMQVHVKSSIPSPPSPSACFDENTNIEMNDGSFKIIKNIIIGDILKNNSIVTSTLILECQDENMYNLNGVIVSGSHSVLYKDKFITIEEHPDKEYIFTYDKPLIYCLNTSSKVIEINNMRFIDWDELFSKEREILLHNMNRKYINNASIKDIHKYYDNGFISFTKIQLFDNTFKEIKDINVGDILENNIKVIGIVQIDGLEIYNNYLGHMDNLNILDVNLQIYLLKSLFLKEQKIYHLLTDTEHFYVNGKKYPHYNSCIDLYLTTQLNNFYL